MTEEVKPQAQRPKMTISEQATFLGRFCRNFQTKDGRLAEDVWLSISQEDMLRFETVWQTMMIMEMHGADQLIRDKIARDRRLGARK